MKEPLARTQPHHRVWKQLAFERPEIKSYRHPPWVAESRITQFLGEKLEEL
jgi:hypothetical protein